MKRIPFKPEHVDTIQAGTKTMTARWKPLPGIKEGDVASAVTRNGKKPAFLVKAAEGFATLKVTQYLPQQVASHEALIGYCERQYHSAGFANVLDAVDFYLACRPRGADTLHCYWFEVVS